MATINIIEALTAKHIKITDTNSDDEIRLQCPQCKLDGLKFEDNKMYVNIKKQVFQCKRCETTGGWRKLFQLFGITGYQSRTPSLKDIKNELRRERARDNSRIESVLPKAVVPAWTIKKARTFLRRRGFNRASAERHGLLYCPRGFYKNRIIFPVFDHRGKYRTFVARLCRERDSRTSLKYLYPEGARTSRLLYGLHTDTEKKRRRFTIIGEGIFDAIHCAPYGVASFGTNISKRQVELLRELGIKRVVLIYDNDKDREVRIKVRATINKILKQLREHFTCGAVWLPKKGTDPTDYPRKKLIKWSKQALKSQSVYVPRRRK